MTKDILRYDLMVQEALKGVVRKILIDAGRDGLPGEHHFYVTFRTTAPGVRLSQRLREKHPEEMTVVLQHQFWDLNVSDHSFEVGLSFSGVPERLLVPFDSITTFFDPSVQFGLKFETMDSGETPAADEPATAPGKLRGAGSEPGMASPAALPLPTKTSGTGGPVSRLKQPVESSESAGDTPDTPATEGDEGAGAQIVSLDAFRKKP